jgi:hypothetical protein
MPSNIFVYPQLLNLTPLLASGNTVGLSLPPRSLTQSLTFHIKFTLGSLTSAQFFVQALNPDGTTWADLQSDSGGSMSTAVLSATANVALPCFAPGVKQLRMRYVATGTLTSSAVVIDTTTQQ